MKTIIFSFCLIAFAFFSTNNPVFGQTIESDKVFLNFDSTIKLKIFLERVNGNTLKLTFIFPSDSSQSMFLNEDRVEVHSMTQVDDLHQMSCYTSYTYDSSNNYWAGRETCFHNETKIVTLDSGQQITFESGGMITSSQVKVMNNKNLLRLLTKSLALHDEISLLMKRGESFRDAILKNRGMVFDCALSTIAVSCF